MKKYIHTFLGLLLLHNIGFSQIEDSLNTTTQLKKIRLAYLGITVGATYSSFRDLATSPLIYIGYPVYTQLSYQTSNLKRTSSLAFSYSFGQYNNNFNKHLAISNVHALSLEYTLLYRLNNLSTKGFNVKIGGLFKFSFNHRINTALLNNAHGLEMIPTLFGSIKFTKDLSSKKSKHKKLSCFKHQTKPLIQNLAFTLNIGFLNSSYRNSYVYTTQSFVINKPNILYGHEFKFFSGFRIGSTLDYTIALNNKNKIQISYLWETYTLGAKLDQFIMAFHILKISLFFNLKNT